MPTRVWPNPNPNPDPDPKPNPDPNPNPDPDQRKKRVGMFSANPSEGDKKLYDMYHQINARPATAL